MADLDWSKYSEPEPDLAPYLENIPHLVFTPDSISETRKLSRERLAVAQSAQRPLLPSGLLWPVNMRLVLILIHNCLAPSCRT